MKEKEFNEILGRKIWAKRAELGISREEFAKQLGFKSASSIEKIEHGKSSIDMAKLFKASKILHYDLDLMLSNEETSGLLIIREGKYHQMSLTLTDDEIEKVMDVLKINEKQESNSEVIDHAELD